MRDLELGGWRTRFRRGEGRRSRTIRRSHVLETASSICTEAKKQMTDFKAVVYDQSLNTCLLLCVLKMSRENIFFLIA